jgi:ATP-dependent Lon protease
LKMVILPTRNEADLEDIPEEVRKEMDFVFAETVDDVFDAALEPAQLRESDETAVEKQLAPSTVVSSAALHEDRNAKSNAD